MSIKPQYQTQTYFRRELIINSRSIVECRFAGGDDLADVIAVHAQVSPADCTVSSGRVNYGGRLVCTVVYADEGGKLCRVQKGAEFAHFADNDGLAPAQTGVCRLTCVRTQLKRDGSSIVVSAVVNADITVYCQAERAVLTEAQGAVCDSREEKFINAVLFSGASEVEDEFEAENVSDVLVPAAHPLVYGCEIKSGAVEVSGEIALSLLAVRAESPVCIERVVPFKAEIECDCAQALYAECAAAVSELSVTAHVDEERGGCVLECACALSFSGVLYEEEARTVVRDLFSAENALNITRGGERVMLPKSVESLSRRVSSAAATKAKLDFSCAFKAVALPSVDFTYNEEEGAIEGAVTASLIYERSGELASTEITLPFSVKCEGGESTCEVAACGVSVRQRAEGECEAEAVLKIAIVKREQAVCEYVTAVDEGEPITPNGAAISVYIPSAGDELWDVCKKLLKSPADVTACNPELKFPLTGRERITVYRRKEI